MKSIGRMDKEKCHSHASKISNEGEGKITQDNDESINYE
jgi:hypothetical protein